MHDDALSPAYDGRLERQHLPNGVHGLFGLAFLNEADGSVDHHHRKDHAGIHPVAQGGRDQARRKQDIDEDVVELQQEPEKHAAPPRRWQPIGAVLREPPSGLSIAQARVG